MRLRFLLALAFAVLTTAVAPAQETPADAPAEDPRAATGGAQTLEDILRRQEGQEVDNAFRRNGTADSQVPPQDAPALGPLGGQADSELWRDIRFNDANVTTQVRGQATKVLVQDSGMAWLQFREGPLAKWGGYSLIGIIVLLAVFYLLRGRIRIDGPKTGRTITRFTAVERFGHWLLAGSFILLGLTGLYLLFGRLGLIALIGQEAYATGAQAAIWVHNNVAWAFMVGLALVIVMWIAHNLPDRTDLKWLAVGGGMFKKGVHPPARKFNAGQKLIFWAVVILGLSISASGLSLLFPFELPMFAKTFAVINDIGIPGWFGMEPLPIQLAPHTEMQLAQAWHGIVAFAFMVIIVAHIYIGSVGMEGAFDAMGSGQVDEQWAREHHGLWVEEMEHKGRKPQGQAAPAE